MVARDALDGHHGLGSDGRPEIVADTVLGAVAQ